MATDPSQIRCIAVTALTSCSIGPHRLLLAGRGSFLEILGLSHGSATSVCLGTWKLLDEGSIHGIIAQVEPAHGHNDVLTIRLLVYGSYSIRVAKLTCRGDLATHPPRVCGLSINASYEICEWVLHVVLLPAESISGWYALLITAQNTLYAVSKRNHEMIKVCYGSRSMLYSACVSFTKTGHVLVAAGTVFGEVIIWSCHLPKEASTSMVTSQIVLTGHTGSVFGINLLALRDTSQREEYLLASCSDDRTVKVWSFDRQRFGSNERSDGLVAVNQEERLLEDAISMTSAWAHLSRIWKVQFLDQSADDNSSERHLISCGEDGSCYVWTVELDTESYFDPLKLRKMLVDRHHSVKNIWSCTTFCSTEACMIATGGADGRIVLRRVLIDQAGKDTSVSDLSTATFAFLAHGFQPLIQSPFSKKRTGLGLKQFRLLSNQEIIALTDTGLLMTIVAGDGAIIPSTANSWESHNASTVLLATDPSHSAYTYAATSTDLFRLRRNDLALPKVIHALSEPPASLFVAHSQEERSAAGACLVVIYRGSHIAELIWDSEISSSSSTPRSQICLPLMFSVAAASFVPSSSFLILGSRSGALALYSGVDQSIPMLQCTSCIRHVHSSDSITAILHLSLPSPLSTLLTFHILTCGRGGTFAIHSISTDNSTNARSVEFITLHVSSPPLGPNIEGAYMAREEWSPNRREIMLYGFRSTEFVVWNQSTQVEFLHVECGGAHRSWAYRPTESGAGGTLVWTKAGSLNHYHKSGADVQVVAQGGHGREIKTVASQRPISPNVLGCSPSLLIATGAEDTYIRLWKIAHEWVPDGSESAEFYRCIGVMKNHTAGLQHLSFSPCQRFLFSSAGREEFFVWRLSTNVPVIDIGVILWDTMPKNEHDFDNRITHFTATSLNENGDSYQTSGRQYRFLMAYSNGKIKVVDYRAGDLPRAGLFLTIHEFVVGDFCLSTISVLSTEIYHHILVTGTNGYLYGSNINVDPSSSSSATPTSTVTRHRSAVHQNSIQTSQVAHLDNNYSLSTTGGDDNAISLAIVPVTAPELIENSDHTPLSVLRIPAAHAAAVTAISIVEVSSHRQHTSSDEKSGTSSIAQVIFASTSNDQRIKLWRVRIRMPTSEIRQATRSISPALNTSGQEQQINNNVNFALATRSLQTIPADDIEVRRLRDCERTTDVADVSGMEVLAVRQSGGSHASDASAGLVHTGLQVRLLVVGAGMESLTIDVPEKYLI